MAVGYETRESPTSPYTLHCLQLVVNYNDTGISTGKAFSKYLPKDAEVVYTKVRITAAFNAGTTNVLTVGTNSTSYDNLVAAGDCDEATTGADIVWTGAELDTSSVPLLPYAKYTQTGAAASAGRAIITIAYFPPVDR